MSGPGVQGLKVEDRLRALSHPKGLYQTAEPPPPKKKKVNSKNPGRLRSFLFKGEDQGQARLKQHDHRNDNQNK